MARELHLVTVSSGTKSWPVCVCENAEDANRIAAAERTTALATWAVTPVLLLGPQEIASAASELRVVRRAIDLRMGKGGGNGD